MRTVWATASALGALGLVYLYGLQDGAPISQAGAECQSLRDDPESVWDTVRPLRVLEYFGSS